MIQNSWANNYYENARYKRHFTPEQFNKHHRPLREAILSRPTVAVIIVTSTQDPDLIIGYCIVEKPKDFEAVILHFIYIKKDFRTLGIAKELVSRVTKPERSVFYTHKTGIVQTIFTGSNKQIRNYQTLDKYKSWHFMPHMI